MQHLERRIVDSRQTVSDEVPAVSTSDDAICSCLVLQRDVTDVPENPNEEASRLLLEGAEIGWGFIDEVLPGKESPMYAIAVNRARITHGEWSDEDVTFPFEAAAAFLGTVCSHVVGLANTFAAGDPVRIHPVMTLIRSEAEAAGLMMWMLEPFVAPSGVHEEVEAARWLPFASTVLARAQLLMIDSLNDRAKRRRAEGNGEAAAEADEGLADHARRIKEQDSSEATNLTGTDRKAWRVAGERLPTRTQQSTISTEYAYGQDARFSGMNPYPMLSGHAHASLDVAFAYTLGRRDAGMSALFAAAPSEVRKTASLAIRILAASLDFFANAVGQDRTTLDAWTEASDRFVLGP